jgi:hypothetical protein
MSFSAPKAPDPTATSNAQQQYNVDAAKSQNNTNSYNQGSAFGSINYVPDASSPSGYSVKTQYSAPEQALFDQYTGTQGAFGAAAPGLVSAGASNIMAPANLDNSAVTKQLNSWQQQYQQPIFNQQDSNLEAQLRSQGLTPGSEAYNNAKNLLARNQGDVTNQFLTMNQGQSFDQALKAFQARQQQGQTEAQLGGTLFGAAAPQGPTQVNTPTASIQPANYQGAVQSNYEQQMKNYENTWNNIGKLGTAAVGLAAAPFTGGTSLMAAIPGMFGGGGGGGGGISYGGPQGPTAFYGNNTSGGWG